MEAHFRSAGDLREARRIHDAAVARAEWRHAKKCAKMVAVCRMMIATIMFACAMYIVYRLSGLVTLDSNFFGTAYILSGVVYAFRIGFLLAEVKMF